MMEKHFIVGAFLFRVIAPEGFPIPENFLKFEQKQKPEEEPRNQTEPEEKPKPKAAEFTYRIDAADEIPQPAGSLIAERTGLQVYRAPGVKEGESRVLFFASPDPDGQPHCAAPYASYEEISEAEAQILVSRERLFLLQYDTGFTSLFALERQMIHHDGIILHCAYIVWHGHAILFSAPSQTGKSRRRLERLRLAGVRFLRNLPTAGYADPGSRPAQTGERKSGQAAYCHTGLHRAVSAGHHQQLE